MENVQENTNLDDKDLSLQPVQLITDPGDKYDTSRRLFQGIPTIERTQNGRLWAAWYSGGKGEGAENYVLVVKSDDDGHSWSKPLLVIDPPGKVRAFDSCLWIDPLNRLWLFWAQSYTIVDGRFGVWASMCANPEEDRLQWTSPQRLAHGIMMNKPTVLSSGEWLLPTAIWAYRQSNLNNLPDERYSNVLLSTDQGKSFTKQSFADVPDRTFDEHMIIERKDCTLWMLVRTLNGIGESISTDRGKTWEPGRPTQLGGPNSRFFIRRLRSGRLLLINHYGYTSSKGRSHLTAKLSEDDGITWNEGLLLDERENVSYPDGIEAPDGTIYIIYDRERQKDKEILMAVFNEEDVMAGRYISSEARMKVIINKAGSEDETR